MDEVGVMVGGLLEAPLKESWMWSRRASGPENLTNMGRTRCQQRRGCRTKFSGFAQEELIGCISMFKKALRAESGDTRCRIQKARRSRRRCKHGRSPTVSFTKMGKMSALQLRRGRGDRDGQNWIKAG